MWGVVLQHKLLCCRPAGMCSYDDGLASLEQQHGPKALLGLHAAAMRRQHKFYAAHTVSSAAVVHSIHDIMLYRQLLGSVLLQYQQYSNTKATHSTGFRHSQRQLVAALSYQSPAAVFANYFYVTFSSCLSVACEQAHRPTCSTAVENMHCGMPPTARPELWSAEHYARVYALPPPATTAAAHSSSSSTGRSSSSAGGGGSSSAAGASAAQAASQQEQRQKEIAGVLESFLGGLNLGGSVAQSALGGKGKNYKRNASRRKKQKEQKAAAAAAEGAEPAVPSKEQQQQQQDQL